MAVSRTVYYDLSRVGTGRPEVPEEHSKPEGRLNLGQPELGGEGPGRVAGERRQFPGSFGYLWCRECKARFVVAGRRERHESPATGQVACPECGTDTRMALPLEVTPPFRVLTVNDAMRRED